MEKCEALGLPYAPIARPVELFDDPHLNASGGLVPVTLPDGRRTKLPALPLALDGGAAGGAARSAGGGAARGGDGGGAGL